MHAIKQIPPHQAIAATTENVEPGTARHKQSHPVTVGVEEALEQGFPFRVFVQFVEDRHRWPGAQSVQLQRFGQRGRAAQEAPPVIGIVPVEVGVAESPAYRGLADLAWPGDQGHLTVSLQVILQNSGIKAQAFNHATIVACVVK
jgi:hypothetical protein